MTPVFREVVAMSFFVNLLALAVPVFTMQVYNRVVNNAGISTLQGLVVGMFLVLIFDYVLRQSRARILQTVALRVDVELGRRLFRKLMRLPLQNLESQPSAHWSSLFRDVDVIRNTLSGSTALLVADLPFAFLFLVLIFIIAAPVAWVLLVMLPVFMFIAWRSANIMGDASGQERQSTQTRDSLIAEMIAGRTTIKALALDRSMEPVWEEKHAQNIENAIVRGSKTDGFSNLGASLSLITSLLLTTVGALAIIDQNLTIGALIATNMLSGRIMGPLNQLVGTWRVYSGFVQSAERLGVVFAASAEREESEVQLEKPKGKLTVENVVFAYAEGQAPVVSGISLEIEPGGVHALVGRNGSGKTTLLKILQGLYQPQKGRVLMDGADIAQFTRSELADWLGYVPQESVLFAGTVRDNITSRQPHASDEEIIKAATEAGVHHFIIDLPDGYATEIGEAGSRLSGGQRQRIAIARALVGDPPVVLLDEPSSSLDRHAEHELKDTLTKIAKTRTVIMVSHSPTLLSACDFLYALDRGKLALAGPAREILPRLFGGKAPPPKDDGPKPGPGKGPGGGHSGGPGKPGGGAPKPSAGIPAPAAAPLSAKPTSAPALQPLAGAQAGAQTSATAKVAAALRTAKPTPPVLKPLPKPKVGAQLRTTASATPPSPAQTSPRQTSPIQANAKPAPATPIGGAATKPLILPNIIGPARPTLRSAPKSRAAATPDTTSANDSSLSTPTPHKGVRVGAQLRPSTTTALQHWAETGNGGRNPHTTRSVGARSRSTPTTRRPSGAE
ncbi:MAG: ATP-binding cassette domain-containing protein [Rhodospirillales bacterium]|nr:ATP-binding cassette domain-containing protein [Rhodospirillales bacterium]